MLGCYFVVNPDFVLYCQLGNVLRRKAIIRKEVELYEFIRVYLNGHIVSAPDIACVSDKTVTDSFSN